MRVSIYGIFCLALGGCTLAVPVTGYIGDKPAQGQAEASTNGDGTFYVLTTSGLRCGGKYDSLDTNPTITVPVSCSDGRKGHAIITRNQQGTSGSVIAELEDGTTGRFVFGNLAFQQGAGASGAVAY